MGLEQSNSEQLENIKQNETQETVDNNTLVEGNTQKSNTIIAKLNRIQEKYGETPEGKALIEKIQALKISTETEKQIINYLEGLQEKFGNNVDLNEVKMILGSSSLENDIYEEFVDNEEAKTMLDRLSLNNPTILFYCANNYIYTRNNEVSKEKNSNFFSVGSVPINLDNIDDNYLSEKKSLTIGFSNDEYQNTSHKEIYERIVYALSHDGMHFLVGGDSSSKIQSNNQGKESEMFQQNSNISSVKILSNVNIKIVPQENGVDYVISYNLYTKESGDE